MTQLDIAAQIAAQYLPNWVGVPLREMLDPLQQVRNALSALEDAERALETNRQTLLRMSRLGLATDNDFRAYDILRGNLYDTELGMYSALQFAVVNTLGERAAGTIPAPIMAPAVPRPDRMWTLRDPPPLPRAFRGGRYVAVAYQEGPIDQSDNGTALAGLGAIPLWAGLALAAVIALGLVALILYNAGEQLARIFVVKEQTTQHDTTVAARERTYVLCLENGGSSIVCAISAGYVVPTPAESVPLPEQTNPYKWLIYGAAATIVLAGAYVVWDTFGDAIRGALSGAPQTVRAQRITARASRVKDLDGPSTYDLEVRS